MYNIGLRPCLTAILSFIEVDIMILNRKKIIFLTLVFLLGFSIERTQTEYMVTVNPTTAGNLPC